MLEEHDLHQSSDQHLPVHGSRDGNLVLPASLDGLRADCDLLRWGLATRSGGLHLDVDAGGPGPPGVETAIHGGLDPVGRDREQLGTETDDPVGADLLEFPDGVRKDVAGTPDEELSGPPPGHHGHLEGESRNGSGAPERQEEASQKNRDPHASGFGP